MTDEPMSTGEKKELQEEYKKDGRCDHCGGMHLRACPRVREFQFHSDGRIAGVKFWKTWSDEHVTWPEEIFEDDDEAED